MGAALDDPSFVHDKDLLGRDDGGKSMGDHDHRAPLRQARKRLLHFALGVGVHRRSRLIENEDRGVLQEGAGDGHALPFAAGQPDAPLSDKRVEALGQRVRKAIASRQPGRFAHLVISGIGPSKANVVPNAHREHVAFLEHEGDMAGQLVFGHAAHVGAAYAHRPFVRIPKSADELGHRRLSRPGRTHDGGELSLRGREAHVVQHGLGILLVLPCVGEAHVAERNLGVLRRPNPDDGQGLFPEDRLYAPNGFPEHVHPLGKRAKLAHRSGSRGSEHEEKEGRRQQGVDALPRKQHRDQNRGDERRHRKHDRPKKRHAHCDLPAQAGGEVAVRLDIRLEARKRCGRLAEHLDRGHAVNVFRRRRVDAFEGVEILLHSTGFEQPDHRHELPEEPDEQHNDDHERQAYIEDDHPDNQEHEQCDRAHEVGKLMGEKALELIHVGLHDLNDLPGRVSPEERDGKRRKVMRERLPYAANRAERIGMAQHVGKEGGAQAGKQRKRGNHGRRGQHTIPCGPSLHERNAGKGRERAISRKVRHDFEQRRKNRERDSEHQAPVRLT